MGRTLNSDIQSYKAAEAAFNARPACKRRGSMRLAPNTYLEADSTLTADGRPYYYAVRLHDTDIVKFWENGDVDLNTGGWYTATTRHRMRAFIPRSNWPKGDKAERRPFLRWSLRVERKTHGWFLDLDRIEYVPPVGDDAHFGTYKRSTVKSYKFDGARLYLKHAPRTAGGFRLPKSEAD